MSTTSTTTTERAQERFERFWQKDLEFLKLRQGIGTVSDTRP